MLVQLRKNLIRKFLGTPIFRAPQNFLIQFFLNWTAWSPIIYTKHLKKKQIPEENSYLEKKVLTALRQFLLVQS